MLELVKMTIKNKKRKMILDDLEKKLSELFINKFPSLPEKIKKIIVKCGPYLAVILLILSVPVILAFMGVAITMTSLVFLGGVKGCFYIVSVLLGVVMIILQIMAIPGLFKRKIKSWRLLFYISLISALLSLLKFDLGGLIIGAGLSWYILFQIKSYYK
ncbi:MAG: hypothetical protein PHS06_03230 [Candidatus Shapirobacteria bacterium]|nr:hypothetical protein [Candidatus Shapirobacteria bacterium]